MILRSKPDFRDILFAVNGSILPRILPQLAGIAVVTAVAVFAADEHPGIFAKISAIPFTLIGIALSVFMSFRNSTCYARWWDGRKFWGELIIACRSLARQASGLNASHQRFLLHGLCGFTAGLAARLRGSDELAEIGKWFDPAALAESPNPTNTVLHELGTYCITLMHNGELGAIHYSVIEGQLTALSDVQGSCERIAHTPVPFAYSLLLHRTALVFCTTLPFALAGSLAWWTLLPVLLVAYTFFGLDALGHQLEDPFGSQPNALPLNALQRIVEREMLSALGSKDLPEPIQPKDNMLT
ncbi:bestrophin family protein [uncultured Bosea sp.]|uniref:bestrophin family protein n=1 Tax=uncultured Bosea sp. TaxID=211457 RepID=UPI0025F64B79|nr:bestrophin family protein [uncultured Bosea sp.]